MLAAYRTRNISAWRNLSRQAKAIIGYEIWFTLINLLILAPLSSWFINRLLVTSGKLAVANEDIIAFLLSPLGILFGLLSVAFFLALAYLERVGLIIIFAAAFQNKALLIRQLLWIELKRFWSIIRLGLLQAAVYIAVSLPFFALCFLTYNSLLRKHDITYYLVAKPPEWRTAFVLGCVFVFLNLVVITYIYLRWLFAVPILVFERIKPKEALKRSWKQTRPVVLNMGVTLALWVIGLILLVTFFNWILKTLFAFSLGMAGLKLELVFPLVLVALTLLALANLFFVIMYKSGHVFLVIDFYFSAAGDGIPDYYHDTAHKIKVPRLVNKIIWITASVILTLILVGESFHLESFNIDRKISVTAHRGSSFKAPENTMSALRQAVADKADFAEIDVQTTADGVVILMHDGDLMRFLALNRWIRDMKYEELREFDIGSWFSPEFSGERPLTLQEAITYAEERIRLNVELKYNWKDPSLAEKVGNIIRDNSFSDKCVVSTTDREGLQQFRKLFPEVRSGPIILRAIGNIRKIDADFLSISAAMASPRVVRQAHKDGMEIHVWTVNDLNTALAMIELGVDNIITDRPSYILNAIKTWNDFSVKQKVALWLRNLVLKVDPDLVEEL
jgi:glycerophosphoryl diester phosphodiesterase